MRIHGVVNFSQHTTANRSDELASVMGERMPVGIVYDQEEPTISAALHYGLRGVLRGARMRRR